ncbi:MAG: glycosyltransferase family 4 protein [archaeon]|nr:glycosyltransferase family 4 protein [archaeon]
MKVSFISEFTEKYGVGGITEFTKRLSAGLKKEGVEVVINKGYKKADVIHMHTAFHQALYVSEKYKDKPLVATVHSPPEEVKDSYGIPSRFFPIEFGWKYLCFLYSKLDRVVVPAPIMRKVLAEHDIKATDVISNGVDLKTFRRNRDYAREFREKYGLFGDFILSVSQIVPRKNVDMLPKLAKEIDCEFVHIGKRHILSSVFYETKVKKTNCSNLRYLGRVPVGSLIGAYSSAKLFLHPSYRESEGLTILEAMACKVPIVARNLCVYSTYLFEGKNAVLCANKDDFVSSIQELLRNEREMEKLSKGAYAEALKHDFRDTVREYVNLYDSLLNK